MEGLNANDANTYFSKELLGWYDVHKRDLPWRRSRNPYYIWISEVMLQQTRVETVIPYYHRFVEQFPTVEALADAPEEQVLKAWEGLGYYSRARNLQAAVREVKERYGGKVPDTPEDISSLKGVGPYTAGAVLSIAYNKPEPAVDGNVMRVLSRYFLLRDDIAKPATRVAMERLARELIPEGKAGDFNQALMELGATVCTPKSPHCLTCPVMERCAGRLEGAADELPVKTKAKPPRPEARAVAYIEGAGPHAGRVLIRQRPKEGLLARMWELPHVLLPETASGATLADTDAAAMRYLREKLEDEHGLEVEPVEPMMDESHTFSHIEWRLRVYRCRFVGFADDRSAYGAEAAPGDGSGEAAGAGREEGGFLWFGDSEMKRYALPNVFAKILRQAAPFGAARR
ncbi:A/G-specific adenine glycosylase [Paenibacillus sp. GYB003]|uniref:A/G-specific adenine glycosylase n=1 Tax=Paenibacillus sp. GYB003 TaxID=2994392 RepID=UPI002F9691AA